MDAIILTSRHSRVLFRPLALVRVGQSDLPESLHPQCAPLTLPQAALLLTAAPGPRERGAQVNAAVRFADHMDPDAVLSASGTDNDKTPRPTALALATFA